jgi:hypothetical protein
MYRVNPVMSQTSLITRPLSLWITTRSLPHCHHSDVTIGDLVKVKLALGQAIRAQNSGGGGG